MTITYNGQSLTTDGVTFQAIPEGIFGNETRQSEQLLVGRDGGIIHENLLGMKNIVLEGRVRGSTPEEFFQRFKTLSQKLKVESTPRELAITTWDNVTRLYYAVVIAPPIAGLSAKEGNITYVDFRVEFRCEKPYSYSSNLTSVTIPLSEGGGFEIPVEIPIAWVGGVSDEAVFVNDGNTIVYPTIKIDGPCLYPRITNLTTGVSMAFPNLEIFAGEQILIEFGRYGTSITKNGVNIFNEAYGEYPNAIEGNNTYKFGASRYDSSALATISANISYTYF